MGRLATYLDGTMGHKCVATAVTDIRQADCLLLLNVGLLALPLAKSLLAESQYLCHGTDQSFFFDRVTPKQRANEEQVASI